MLYLVTGTPGSGKTLNTIKFIRENKQFADREIYFFGIRNLSDEFGWIELSEEQAYNWHDLPSNSVIVFDEAYNIFPTKHGAKGTPDHVSKLAVHRHKGFDIFLICQKVTGQLDTFVRGLVNRHQHYARIMGSLNINRFTWDVCQTNPDSPTARKDSNVDQFRMDKKYFGAYHSADEHTHTLSVPWKKIAFMGVLVVLLVLLVRSLLGYFNREPESFDQYNSSTPGMPPIYSSQQAAIPPLTYAELLTPEIDGMPWTAPIYRDSYTDVQDWPRPAACYVSERTGCRCFTQQASRLDVSEDICAAIVAGGWFDHTKPVTRHHAPFSASQAAGGGDVGRVVDTPHSTITSPIPDFSIPSI